jgi:hypothetical protein
MAYTLDAVQQDLYVHTVDLYRPVDAPGGIMADKSKGGQRYVLAYPSVPCYLMFTTEFAVPQAPGRTKTLNFETQDVLHLTFDKGENSIQGDDAWHLVGDEWKFKFTTDGHSEEGGWWSILGNPKALDRAATKEFQTSRDLKPPLLASA